MIRKRTTLTTTERRQRLFCLLFGCILLGTAWGMVMLRWQYDGVPTGWAGFLGMFFQTKPTLPALWTESAGDILLFLLAFFLLGFSAVGQPFAWLLLLTYGVCMGGTLQTQCSAGGAFVRSTTLRCYFVPMSALLVLAARESLRFSGYFTAYGFRNEPEEQMYHQLRMYCARFVVLAVFLLLFGFAYGTAFYAAVK